MLSNSIALTISPDRSKTLAFSSTLSCFRTQQPEYNFTLGKTKIPSKAVLGVGFGGGVVVGIPSILVHFVISTNNHFSPCVLIVLIDSFPDSMHGAC